MSSAEAWVSSAHLRDRGSGCNSPRRHCVWHKSSWRRSPLSPPDSHQANDPQTGEQLYQRSSCTIAKVLGPTTDSLNSRSGKGNLTLKASGFSLWNFHRTGETDSWRAQTKFYVHQDPRERNKNPQETKPDLPVSFQESLAEAWANSGLPQPRGTEYNSPGSPGVCWH